MLRVLVSSLQNASSTRGSIRLLLWVVGSLASSALGFEVGKLLQYYSKRMKKYRQVSFQRFTIFRPVWVVVWST